MRRCIPDNMLSSFKTERHIAPLAVVRIAFGAIMFVSTIRFILKGWVTDFYVTPQFFFPFYGFEWVKPLDENGMYGIFILMAVASLGIMLGLLYRVSTTVFFCCFCYVELIDKTNYLNHYYFVSLIAFLMMLVPAHRYFSLDVLRKPALKITRVPAWTIGIFKVQLCIVYFFAGFAKINYDWLLEALPLRIWLPANAHLPIVGTFLTEEWLAFLFSWVAMLYDLFIWVFLLNRKTRPIAYVFVVVFHLLTASLFKIGMFPYIMMFMTVIFFSEDFHKRLIESIRTILGAKDKLPETPTSFHLHPFKEKFIDSLLVLYFVIQLVLPFRYLLYPGELFWTEEGFRFSWRVMLMEKAGTAFFYVLDSKTGNKTEVNNNKYLTRLQEKMMCTQPDMLLQYAHFLDKEYQKEGIKDPIVTVESYVTLNGSGSRLFVDSTVDLSAQRESFLGKKWILPFHNN